KHSFGCRNHRPGELIAGLRVAPNRSIGEIRFLLDCFFNFVRLRSVGELQVYAIISRPCISTSAFRFESGVLGGILSGDVVVFRQTPQKLLGFHSHHEVRAALQVKAEVNVVLQRLLDSRPGEVSPMWTVPRADDQIKSDDCYCGDDDYARKKVLFLHCRNLMFASYVPLRWLTIDVGYRGTGNFEDRFVCTADQK